ncbi:MAG: alanine/glycine:cation symporter family protein [Myxococcales bacterium]|jgi:AGCS family alanine or glycine:cation symporter
MKGFRPLALAAAASSALLAAPWLCPPLASAQQQRGAAGAAVEQPGAEQPEAPPPAPEPAPDESLEARIDAVFGDYVVAPIAAVLFWDLIFWDDPDEGDTLPIIVAWLVMGAIFFTLRMQFVNVRAFRHAIDVTRGAYDSPDDPGEVSHFQALASALSATVGLGNIAGVAIAVGMGGPGAIFWMVMAGFLGMSSKFTECTLGQVYRVVDDDGHVSGGPMRYLKAGLGELGKPGLGRVLAGLFAIMCIGGSFGGGNMFQSNQSFALVSRAVPALEDFGWAYGLFMAVLVGVVIIGGIRRIGTVAGYIVPAMCGIYVIAGLFVLLAHASHVPAALGQIVTQAFSPQAQFGGLLGVLVTGFKRAAFSNEAGIGSASIAHSAAATDEPVREGIVALLEPFIDTIVICTMTGLVVVITDAYTSGTADGAEMTATAFATVIPWFPHVLALAVFFFAFSTMISWSYYGERCWTTLFGARSSIYYKVLFLVFTFLGPILKLGNVLTFSDLMILGMALPNIAGLLLLAPLVKARLDDYWGRLKAGQMEPVAARARPVVSRDG